MTTGTGEIFFALDMPNLYDKRHGYMGLPK
jgi:hypothetical protein